MGCLDGLNARQREAAGAGDGHFLVSAGPGTGKTRAFTHRAAHLLLERGASPDSILALTFTRGAAGEMRRRVESLLRAAPAASGLERLWIGTFHAAALRLLREEGYPFGPGVPFSVAGEEEKRGLLRGLVSGREIGGFLKGVSALKRRLELPASGPAAEYQRKLLDARLLDFDDLILCALRLLEEKPRVLESWRCRARHILVDEFQDTSPAQYRLLGLLDSGNAWAVGDPDQAVYGFGEGAWRPFDAFRRDRPGARVLRLRENYRSQARILEAASQVIGRNPAALPRELEARLEGGLPVEIAAYAGEAQEAESVARRVEALLGGSSHFSIDSGRAAGAAASCGLSDIAVLYRFHAQAPRVEQALHKAGLPYRRFGPAPRRNGEPVPDAEELRDFTDSDGAAPSPRPASASGMEEISLMTLHRAKGLEFSAVFILGCEDGVLPWRPEDAEPELEEERRLFYVGMTRARELLVLSRCRGRFLFGRRLAGGPSPFLKDIEERLRVLRENPRARPKPAQPVLFHF